jgi:hypothetical protein
MGRQSALHKENSRFVAPNLGRTVIIVFSKSRDKWLKKKLTWRNDRVYVKIVLYSSVTPLSEVKKKKVPRENLHDQEIFGMDSTIVVN